MLGSVIASAQGSLSKESFLASVESSNSSRASSATTVLDSRKIGRDRASHSTARRTLEIDSDILHELAVPPLSPPLIDDDAEIEA